MRSYSLMLPTFWTGPTGKAITAAGKDTRIVATYLLTSEHANMIGLYRLPLLYASEETGLKRREVLSALEQLKIADFAVYDQETEFVWVFEMARFQLGLLPHEAIKEGDHRAEGAARLYKQLAPNPFLLQFHDRYAQILRLPLKRDFLIEKKPLGSPLGGASETLIRGYDPDPDPDPVRKGDTGETTLPSSSSSPRQTVKIPLPERFMISADLWKWTAKKEFTSEFVEREFEKFCNRNRANAEKYADWDAAFRNWLLKAPEFAAARNGHSAQPRKVHPVYRGERIPL